MATNGRQRGGDRLRVGIAVNAPGIQERRALELARRARLVDVTEVAIAPSASASVRLARERDVVYVIDVGKTGAGAFAAGRVLTRCVAEVGDPQAALYRVQGRSGAEIAVGAALDAAVATFATAVVVRGRALAGELRVRRPWTHLPDGVDTGRFSPGEGSATRAALGIDEDALVVGVVGSLTWTPETSWCYGMELVEALAHLKDRDVTALIVGDGTGLEHLRERAGALGVEARVVTPGRVAHDRVPEMLRAMDVCVSTQTDDAIGRGRTTAKLPEYLACDRYVLATRVGEAAVLLPDEMLLGYDGSFDPGYPQRLGERLRQLADERESVRRSGGTRPIAMRHFDYGAITARWEAFLTAVA